MESHFHSLIYGRSHITSTWLVQDAAALPCGCFLLSISLLDSYACLICPSRYAKYVTTSVDTSTRRLHSKIQFWTIHLIIGIQLPSYMKHQSGHDFLSLPYSNHKWSAERCQDHPTTLIFTACLTFRSAYDTMTFIYVFSIIFLYINVYKKFNIAQRFTFSLVIHISRTVSNARNRQFCKSRFVYF